MNFPIVIDALSQELKNPLPGTKAQLKMASMRRLQQIIKHSKPETAVRSSVLILLYPGTQENEILLALIQRPSYKGIHGGQISLPGGKYEEGDIELQNTALRESQEEIGIFQQDVKIIGALSELYIPPSNYIVYPFVGYLDYKPALKPDLHEVAEILEISLDDLLDEEQIRNKKIHIRSGLRITVPCFEINSKTIWGATAMILSEFKEIMKTFSDRIK